jgi:hypothetical protein
MPKTYEISAFGIGHLAFRVRFCQQPSSEASPQTAKKDLCSLDRVVKIAELGSIDLRRTFGGRPLRGRLMLGPIT